MNTLIRTGLVLAMAVCGLPARAEAACVTDLRAVTVGPATANQPLRVRILRAFEFPGDAGGTPDPIPLRADAAIREARWTRVPAEAGVAGADWPGADRATWPIVSRAADGAFHLPAVSGRERLVFFLEYDAPREFGPRFWWVSYVPAVSPGTQEVRLRIESLPGERIAARAVGPWLCRSEISADVEVREWRLDCGSPDLPADLSVLAGTETTWTNVANLLADALSSGERGVAPVAAPAGAGKPGDPAVTIAALFGQLRAFDKAPASPGFAAAPAAATIAARRGNCKDLSLCLARHLAAARVPCWLAYRAPALVLVDDAIPSPYWFNHVLVAVPRDGGADLLDPHGGTAVFRDGLRLGSDVQTDRNLLLVRFKTNEG